MPTTSFTVDDSAYVEISTVDALVQNKSPWPMRIHFGTSAPAANTPDFHILELNQAILKRENFPNGNIYARSGNTGDINKGAIST